MTAAGILVLALGPALLWPLTGSTAPKRQVGIVLPGDEWASGVEGFKAGLAGLGYVEGRDIEYRLDNARRSKPRMAQITEALVAARVDLIFTVTNAALTVVAEGTRVSRVPVVFGSASGPAESGRMPATAVADTHITGVTSDSLELVGKRLEILKEMLPGVKRVAVIGDRESDSSVTAFRLAREAAPRLGLSIIEYRVATKDEAAEVASRITRQDADALFLLPGLHVVGSTTTMAAAARAARLPFAVYRIEHVKQPGALLSYGSSAYLQGKQAALLADKILKGAPPAQLPIERPMRPELILNLETARAIGVRLSPEILNRADGLIGERAR